MDKIYCINCKFYKNCRKSHICEDTFDCTNIHERCDAPQNIRDDYKIEKSDKYISCPSIINRFNNCKWFVSKQPTVPQEETEETFIN